MHAKPVVHETLSSKTLFFSQLDVQSSMDLLQPDVLQFEYTRIMMGFLLHQPRPRKILMIGLGGGSLAKFCYRHLPHGDMTVVEINPHVIAVREAFAIPPDNHRFRVLLADGSEFVRTTTESYDVILADGFDMHGLPEPLCTAAYYDSCYRILTPHGVLVANLHGCNTQFDAVLTRIRSGFHGSLLVVKDPDATNRIAFAVKGDGGAMQSLPGVRRPDGFCEPAWRELVPSMARVFLASRDLKRQTLEEPVHGKAA